MSNLFNDAVKFVASWTGGREDLAANLVSNAIWIIPSVVASVVIYFLNQKFQTPLHKLPLRIIFFATLFKITRWLRGSSITIDGFYYAIYDSSKSQYKESNKSSQLRSTAQEADFELRNNANDDKKRIKESKVAECIYISTALFSSRMTGYVFRRAKRKNGKVKQNDYYSASSIVSSLRIVGSFSQSLQIFFGYWLDPYEPDKVAGTVRLKWVDNNLGVQAHQHKSLLVGHWDGIEKKIVLPINENTQEFYGFAQAGGVWHFHRIGLGISGFNAWRKKLISSGDNPADPSKFLEWRPR